MDTHIGCITAAIDGLDGVVAAINMYLGGVRRLTRLDSIRRVGRPVAAAEHGIDGIGLILSISGKRGDIPFTMGTRWT